VIKATPISAAKVPTELDSAIYSLDVIEALEKPWLLTAQQLEGLQKLNDEAWEYISEYGYGVSLIRHTSFTEYAKDMASEYQHGVDFNSWPFTAIDWDTAADDLKGSYIEIEFNGVTYLALC
jgi:hypothetical protein